MQIEVRHARVVAALANEGSISRAAQRLTLPQPSLTMQLRRIESALGGPLFVRSNSGISPTVLGERIIPLMVELAARADQIASESSSVSAGVIRVATAEWTPVGLRSELAERLPDVELQTVTLEAALCVQAVSDDAHTACVVPCEEAEDPVRGATADLVSEVIFREPMWLAVPAGHPLAEAELADRARLHSLTWVRHRHGHWFHVMEQKFFGKLELVAPEVVHHAAGQAEVMSWVTGAGAAALVSPTGPLTSGSRWCRRRTPSGARCCWSPGAERCPRTGCAASPTRCGRTTACSPAACPPTGPGSAATAAKSASSKTTWTPSPPPAEHPSRVERTAPVCARTSVSATSASRQRRLGRWTSIRPLVFARRSTRRNP